MIIPYSTWKPYSFTFILHDAFTAYGLLLTCEQGVSKTSFFGYLHGIVFDLWVLNLDGRKNSKNSAHCSPIRASVDALCRDGTDHISRERVQRGRLTRQGTTS